MQFSISTEELAAYLNISMQSLRLRMRMAILKMEGSGLGPLDMVEAKLLCLLNLSSEQISELKHELGMTDLT